MKYKIDEFRIDAAQPVEAPLDFATLCELLAVHQAGTPTALVARGGGDVGETADHANPVVAVLLAVPGQEPAGSITNGSFHPAAAARVNEGSQR